jgi:hypothetical protein
MQIVRPYYLSGLWLLMWQISLYTVLYFINVLIVLSRFVHYLDFVRR